MTRPTVVDLFAGAGGMSLGFEQAGFDVVASVEIDPVHSAVHKYNFPKCAVIPKSVIGLDADEVLRAIGPDVEKVDVVCGGAPCQGFSMIGQRAFDDPRNRLVREFVRLTRELKADYFVFENVKGLTLGKHRQFLDELIGEFEASGYEVRLPWKVLNAANYGVPQHRERLILIGAKRGLPIPSYPKPSTRPAGSKKGDQDQGPSCADALSDLPNAEDFEILLDADAVRTGKWGPPSAYARLMRCLDNEAWAFGHPRSWDPQLLTSSMRTGHTAISRTRFREAIGGRPEPISRFYKLAADGVSNTLRAGTDAARGAFTSPRPIHYEHARCVTVREMARLHGFPDWFRFHETKWHGARQIGNSVPPPLARAIAGEIITAMNVTPTQPSLPLDLGDPVLLQMTVSEAAEYWGVEKTPGKRDRKSGAKKRKQEEIEAERLRAA